MRLASSGSSTAASSSVAVRPEVHVFDPEREQRQQDADRTRLISALKTVGIAALDLALVLFIICTVF